MTNDIPEPNIGQVWYNLKGRYRFVIISKQVFRNKFYCLRENGMCPFTPYFDFFEKSEYLGNTITDFKDLFKYEYEDTDND